MMTIEQAQIKWGYKKEAFIRNDEYENRIINPGVVQDDMNLMHSYYGIHQAMEKLSPEQLKEFISFRFRFLQEEVTEGFKAIDDKDGDGVVDSIIDLVVVAVGTLDLLGVDFRTAWNKVLIANMNKKVGIKASRPNPLSLPDLIKEFGWQAPCHKDNLGVIQTALNHTT